MRAVVTGCLAGLFAVSLGWGWQAERGHLARIVKDPPPEIDVQAPLPSRRDLSPVAAGREPFEALEALPVSSLSQAGVESAVLAAETAPRDTPPAPAATQTAVASSGGGAPAHSAACLVQVQAYSVEAPAAAPPGASGDAAAPQQAVRVHVRLGLCESLQDALDVAAQAQSLGYAVSLSNEGPLYQVGIAGDFDAAAAARLARTLRRTGFAAAIIP